MEENLTMDELIIILEAARKQQHQKWRFQASLKGIDLDESSDNSDLPTVEDKINEMRAKQMGLDSETYEFNLIGVAVENE